MASANAVEMKPDPPKSPQLNILVPTAERIITVADGDYNKDGHARLFERLCCCFSIRTMIFLIAAFSMIASLTALLELGRLKCTPGVPTAAVGGFVMVHLLFLMASLLVTGVDQGRRALMKPWLVLQTIKLIILFSFAMVLLLFVLPDYNNPKLRHQLPKECARYQENFTEVLQQNFHNNMVPSKHHQSVEIPADDTDADIILQHATEAHDELFSHQNNQATSSDEELIKTLRDQGLHFAANEFSNDTNAIRDIKVPPFLKGQTAYKEAKPSRQPSLSSGPTSSKEVQLETAIKRQGFAAWALMLVFAIELYFTIVVVYHYVWFAKKEESINEVVHEFGTGFFEMATMGRSVSSQSVPTDGVVHHPGGGSHRRSMHLKVRSGSDSSSVVDDGSSGIQIVITSSNA